MSLKSINKTLAIDFKNTFGIPHFHSCKGPFKYYVSKELGGWGGQMLMFANKVGGIGQIKTSPV